MQPINYQARVDSRLTDLFRHDPIYKGIQKSVVDILKEKQDELFTFKRTLFNIDLSTGKNLDLIGKIVGQPRELIGLDDTPYFGFDGADGAQTFGTITNPSIGGNFRSLINNPFSTTVRAVDDTTYRKLLKARILANKYNGTINATLEIINILAGNNTTKIEPTSESGECEIVLTSPVDPLLNYFISQRNRKGSLIPIPLGINTKVVVV